VCSCQCLNPFLTVLYRWIPLYSSPQVTIHIMPANRTYTLSKDLLCTQSAYFKAAFEGNFQEAQNQTLSLTEMLDVVSIPGFEMPIQWLYIGQIRFEPPILIRSIVEKQKAITSIVEFFRIADMYGCYQHGVQYGIPNQLHHHQHSPR
jgi:BTB/POZ domain